ncbi:uncharacterized protein (UPF0303 family) [Kineothrix alysoides]|uniref:Uncharacterized protein (UPF0303 family) n=1 Tax=Kineothrix alysoides TaxID=1469948 RepID=A0A4R1QQC5_9FIRM|nr:heme-binding protein [Kineothrix alysoides]TCL56019.1 uncharacterized protein (UPF0303 family) [Kineothrix alysoides]
MEEGKYIKIKENIEKQEKILRFDHFSNSDAWELGKFFVERIAQKQIDLAVAIRRLNGNIIFQYATENTNLNNQNWMQRKFNTVLLMNCSSLNVWATSYIMEEQVETHGLSTKDYAFCGGGFPIRLKSGEIVAVLTVSNLPHEQDHQFIVEAISEWLAVENVPSFEESVFS